MAEVTKLNFLDWSSKYESEKPYQVIISGHEADEACKDTNLVFKLSPEVTVQDIRGREEAFTLDDHGFAVRRQQSKVEKFDSADEIDQVYIPEMEALLMQEVEGADRVFVFDWRVSNATDRTSHVVQWQWSCTQIQLLI